MKSTSAVRIAAVATLLAAFGTAAWADSAHKMTMAKDLTWADVPSVPPGVKIAVIEGPMSEAVPFTVRLKFPANYRLPPHFHPAVERVTVLSGVFYMGMGETFDPAKASLALGPGDAMIMVPNTPHFAITKEETVLQLHGTGPWGITYINPADDPRKKQ